MLQRARGTRFEEGVNPTRQRRRRRILGVSPDPWPCSGSIYCNRGVDRPSWACVPPGGPLVIVSVLEGGTVTGGSNWWNRLMVLNPWHRLRSAAGVCEGMIRPAMGWLLRTMSTRLVPAMGASRTSESSGLHAVNIGMMHPSAQSSLRLLPLRLPPFAANQPSASSMPMDDDRSILEKASMSSASASRSTVSNRHPTTTK